MQVRPLLPEDLQIIQGYGDGGFRISGQRWDGAVLVSLGETRPWPVENLETISRQSLEPLKEMDPSIEILLLGCGPRLVALDPQLRIMTRELGMALEPMDSGAACRTFNILMEEQRRVAAALLPI